MITRIGRMRKARLPSSSIAVDGSVATSGFGVAVAAAALGAGVALGAAVGAAEGAGVAVAAATVAAGVAVATAAAEQVERVIASLIKVTVPLRASVRPLTLTPLL